MVMLLYTTSELSIKDDQYQLSLSCLAIRYYLQRFTSLLEHFRAISVFNLAILKLEVRASQLAQASERVGSLIPASQQANYYGCVKCYLFCM